MPISKARHKANEKYNAKAYDEIKVRVGKGQKEVIQASAAECGESLNEFIKKAISERMERDQTQPINASAPPEPASKEQPTAPTSFIERVMGEVEQIVAETDKDEEEEGWENWKKHNTF